MPCANLIFPLSPRSLLLFVIPKGPLTAGTFRPSPPRNVRTLPSTRNPHPGPPPARGRETTFPNSQFLVLLAARGFDRLNPTPQRFLINPEIAAVGDGPKAAVQPC